MQRNKILCFFATIMIAAVTIYAVFRGGGVSFGQLAESIRDASVPGIALSCISMFGFIFFEGEALREIVFHMGYPTKHKDAFVYSAADIYFSAITPSASGGQPASAFFMIKDGMPATTVMAALLVNLIMYTLAVISIGVFAILAFPKIFLNFSVVCKIFIVSGIIVLSVLAIIFYLLLRKQEILKKLAVWLEAFLRKIHCVHAADRIQNKMEAALKDYANCVELIFHTDRIWCIAGMHRDRNDKTWFRGYNAAELPFCQCRKRNNCLSGHFYYDCNLLCAGCNDPFSIL